MSFNMVTFGGNDTFQPMSETLTGLPDEILLHGRPCSVHRGFPFICVTMTGLTGPLPQYPPTHWNQGDCGDQKSLGQKLMFVSNQLILRNFSGVCACAVLLEHVICFLGNLFKHRRILVNNIFFVNSGDQPVSPFKHRRGPLFPIGCYDPKYHVRCWMLGSWHSRVVREITPKAYHPVVLPVEDWIDCECFLIGENEDPIPVILQAIQLVGSPLQTFLNHCSPQERFLGTS